MCSASLGAQAVQSFLSTKHSLLWQETSMTHALLGIASEAAGKAVLIPIAVN